MDFRSIISPAATDKVALEEFIESLSELAPEAILNDRLLDGLGLVTLIQ